SWTVVCARPSTRQRYTPDRLSEQLNVTVGAVLYQPCVPSGVAGETTCEIRGDVVSMRYAALAVLPAESRATTMCAPSPLTVIPEVALTGSALTAAAIVDA